MEGRVPSPSEERSRQDIKLCFDTLLFIDKVSESQKAAQFSALNSLVYNLCSFQYRFSQPMVLPFGLGTDFPEELPRRRPFPLLQRLGLVQKVEPGAAATSRDTMVHEGDTYRLFAGDTVDKSAFLWLADLFTFLALFPEEDSARRLAACWYYTATEANYDEDSEEEEELNSEDERGVGLAVGLGLESIMGTADADDDDEAEDENFEDDEEEDSEYVPSSSEASASVASDVEDEEQQEEARFKAPFPVSRTAEELDRVERGVREAVLGAIETLDALMPSPETHMAYFKRTLAKMQSGAMDPAWFPWGIPPIQRILDRIQQIEEPEVLSRQQDETSDFLREILGPFAAMQAQQAQQQ